jgi:hypothetical protein
VFCAKKGWEVGGGHVRVRGEGLIDKIGPSGVSWGGKTESWESIGFDGSAARKEKKRSGR